MSAYSIYQNSICPIPNFLLRYLELDIMQRLKDISLLCGMEKASSFMYNFDYSISRYDHSLNTALVTWKLTHDKTQTLAALFHDVSTPVFSHVIDYMNGDYVIQESTEAKTKEVLMSSKLLLIYLKEDNINLDYLINFKKYSVVDLPRPCLCADRIENIIGAGMAWAKAVSVDQAIEIIDSIYLTKNESGLDEIGVRSNCVAELITKVNKKLNELTHSNEDTYMMRLLADIVKRTIEEGYIIYDDLFRLTEEEYVNLIESNLDIDYELSDMWNTFRTVREPSIKYQVQVKDMILNPLVRGKRYIVN